MKDQSAKSRTAIEDDGVPVLHCESIRERCAQHNWRTESYEQTGLRQFVWIESGGGRAVIDGARYALAAPSAIQIPPRKVHSFTFEPESEGWIVTAPEVHIKALFAGQAQLGDDLSAAAVFRPHAPEALSALFASVAAEHQTPRSARDEVLGAWLTLIVFAFARAAEARRAQAEAGADRRLTLVRRFRELLDDLDGKKMSLTDIAEKLGVTTTHLTRVCRETLGRPASALIEERVMAAAKRDLVFTPMTVAEVGFRLGFADPAHFSKFFSQRADSTPSGFRDMMRRRLKTGDA
jgi:AraC family transcriptional activator of pobA